MGKQVNIAEAKAKLSQLVDDAAKGEDIVIARAGRPVVRLVAVEPPARRELGFLAPLDIPDEFWAPLEGDELDLWQ
ncbi:MAG: type II toxin-antitoxin system prevent-host-death family antitoxin [Actinobacteria bacterium]|nr:type II toxin-antitoxin system prevent-host-death family antitoxin [Actinomycetota bacterium]